MRFFSMINLKGRRLTAELIEEHGRNLRGQLLRDDSPLFRDNLSDSKTSKTHCVTISDVNTREKSIYIYDYSNGRYKIYAPYTEQFVFYT